MRILDRMKVNCFDVCLRSPAALAPPPAPPTCRGTRWCGGRGSLPQCCPLWGRQSRRSGRPWGREREKIDGGR